MWKYILIILPIFFSCATKKVIVSNDKEDIKKDSIVVEKKDSSFVQQNAITVKEDSEEIEVTPIDTSKPVVIGTTPYFNAVVKIKKKQKKLVDSSKTVVNKTEEKKTEVKVEEKRKSKNKSVDKKTNLLNLWWLLLIPVVIWFVRYRLLK